MSERITRVKCVGANYALEKPVEATVSLFIESGGPYHGKERRTVGCRFAQLADGNVICTAKADIGNIKPNKCFHVHPLSPNS